MASTSSFFTCMSILAQKVGPVATCQFVASASSFFTCMSVLAQKIGPIATCQFLASASSFFTCMSILAQQASPVATCQFVTSTSSSFTCMSIFGPTSRSCSYIYFFPMQLLNEPTTMGVTFTIKRLDAHAVEHMSLIYSSLECVILCASFMLTASERYAEV